MFVHYETFASKNVDEIISMSSRNFFLGGGGGGWGAMESRLSLHVCLCLGINLFTGNSRFRPIFAVSGL